MEPERFYCSCGARLQWLYIRKSLFGNCDILREVGTIAPTKEIRGAAGALAPDVDELLHQLRAPPQLVAHLTLVHDVSCALTSRLDAMWPALRYDRTAVQMGAALHDIGKSVHREELTQPGHAHELAGEALLRAHGFPDTLARFARTHRQWADDLAPQPEDLLVALADTWWRGNRDEQLEAAVCRWIAQQTQGAHWEVFAALDDLATEVTAETDVRLAWQQQFAAGTSGSGESDQGAGSA